MFDIGKDKEWEKRGKYDHPSWELAWAWAESAKRSGYITDMGFPGCETEDFIVSLQALMFKYAGHNQYGVDESKLPENCEHRNTSNGWNLQDVHCLDCGTNL